MKNKAYEIINVEETSQVKDRVHNALEGWREILPENRSARILLKPNFNSNFNALTGNTTDMRVLAAIIEFLQAAGYSNIVIGEGTNSGFVREGISVIHRLKADQLADQYKVDIVDLNAWPQSVDVPLENEVLVQVADLLAEADFVINMPKLKTHYEVGMSVCLKSLIGACIGRENKKKIHGSLAKNIVHLNEVIKPHLHIVDGLIAMEGNGPSRGSPVNFGKVIIGTNPFMIDYLCARLIGFPRMEVKTLFEARRMGYISDIQVKEWESISLDGHVREFRKPYNTPWVAFVIDPRFQKHLIKIRYAPVINQICSTRFVKNIFYATGISQEQIRETEESLTFQLDQDLCDKCNKCVDYCPMDVVWEEIAQGGGDKCINCLYCYSVCPTKAIVLEGEPGFYTDQIAIYDDVIRGIV